MRWSRLEKYVPIFSCSSFSGNKPKHSAISSCPIVVNAVVFALAINCLLNILPDKLSFTKNGSYFSLSSLSLIRWSSYTKRPESSKTLDSAIPSGFSELLVRKISPHSTLHFFTASSS